MCHRLLDRLRLLAECDAELNAWLAGGLSRWRRGDARTLDDALGLSLADAKRARDKSIRAAAGALATEFPDLGPWQIAAMLAAEIQRFETRLRSRVPNEASPWMPHIAEALCQRCQQVRTQRKLYEIISN